jgi:hypothetical protein
MPLSMPNLNAAIVHPMTLHLSLLFPPFSLLQALYAAACAYATVTFVCRECDAFLFCWIQRSSCFRVEWQIGLSTCGGLAWTWIFDSASSAQTTLLHLQYVREYPVILSTTTLEIESSLSLLSETDVPCGITKQLLAQA